MSEPGYLRIGELARRTGASPELLRAWERRYGLLRPTRSQGGFRLYTAADEERIRRMKEYLARGVAAAEAARLAVDAETPGPGAETTTPTVLVPETTPQTTATTPHHSRRPPARWPRRSTGSTRSRPTPSWIACSPPTESRPSCEIC